MSASVSTIIQPAVIKGPAAWLRILNVGWKRITRYFARRAAIATLRELDNRILQDMGIARSEIEAAVRGLIINRARI